MARSAAQKAARSAARRLRDQTRRTFPLSRLPPELQLLILAKCSLKCMRVLMSMSKSLRSLFLAYPEACIQGALQQYPHPVSALIQASWALHRCGHGDFNSQKAMALLEQCKVAEWSTLYPHLLVNDADPIEALEVLFDMCEDVDRLVEVYAHSTAGAVEQVVNPWVKYAPITLSSTEFTRVASAFLMLKIFYQLERLFAHHEAAQASVQKFIRDLQPWQVEQCLSAELFLGSSGFNASSSVYTLIGDRYGARSALSNTSWLFQTYRELTSFEKPWLRLATFSHASSVAERNPAPAISGAPWLQIQQGLDLEVAREDLERTTGQLRNDGWMLYELVRHIDPLRPQQGRQLFLDLGIFFWDIGRLMDWEFTNPDDFPDVVRQFQNRLKTMARYRYPIRCQCCR